MISVAVYICSLVVIAIGTAEPGLIEFNMHNISIVV
jgi:hypothetical protein